MSVELKVTLVGEDPQQQAAFNNPNPAPAQNASIAPIATQPSQPAQQPQPPVVQPATPQPSAQVQPPPIPSWYVQPPPINYNARLITTIEQLIDAINDLTANGGLHQQPTSPVTHSTPTRSQHHSSGGGWFDRIAESIDKKIDDLGMAHTAIGNLVSSMTHSVTGFGTRATKFASNIFSTGTAATAAASASSASATTGAGAAASGSAGAAASTGAASAGATGALAASGPLIAVALAAGAAALSVKKFLEAVEHTAASLEDLSPEIAAGQAQHQVKMELARLDRAQRIGSDVAGLDHAQHRLSESMYEIQTKIYELVLKASPVIEFGVDSLNVIVRTLDVMIATANDIAAKITPDPTDNAPAAKALNKSMAELAEAIKELGHTHSNHSQPMIDPLFQELLNAPSSVVAAPKAPNKGNGLGAHP